MNVRDVVRKALTVAVATATLGVTTAVPADAQWIAVLKAIAKDAAHATEETAEHSGGAARGLRTEVTGAHVSAPDRPPERPLLLGMLVDSMRVHDFVIADYDATMAGIETSFVVKLRRADRELASQHPDEIKGDPNIACSHPKTNFKGNRPTEATDDEVKRLGAAFADLDASFVPVHVDGTASSSVTCRWRGSLIRVKAAGTPTYLLFRDTVGRMHITALTYNTRLAVSFA